MLGILYFSVKAVNTFGGFSFLVPTLFARECIPCGFPRKEHGNQAKSNIPACLQQTGKSITKFEGCPIMFADGQFYRGDHRLWQVPIISYWRIL